MTEQARKRGKIKRDKGERERKKERKSGREKKGEGGIGVLYLIVHRATSVSLKKIYGSPTKR